MYEGLSAPTLENYLYAAKAVDQISPDMENAILNTDRGGLRGLKNKFLEIIAPINPFHLRQQTHPLGYHTIGIKNGLRFKQHYPYPFKKMFTTGAGGHFDPTEDTDLHIEMRREHFGAGPGKIVSLIPPKVPYVCEMEKKKLSICKLANDEAKCKSEADNFLEICPNFALHTYRQNKLFNEKAKLIQRREYQEAMRRGEYNKNRTMADVSKNSSYHMGMANNLRPDSMWADDRYINITQKEINEARAKLGMDNQKFDYSNIKGIPQQKSDEAVYSKKPRMY